MCVRRATAADDAGISTACDVAIAATAATVAGPAGVDRWLLQIYTNCLLYSRFLYYLIFTR